MRLGSFSFYATPPLQETSLGLCTRRGQFSVLRFGTALLHPSTPTLDLHPQITLFRVKRHSAGTSFLSCRAHFLFFLCLGEY